MSDEIKVCDKVAEERKEDRGFLDKIFPIHKVTTKMIKTHELGYKCRACDILNVYYNTCQKPTSCMNCGSDELHLKFHDIVHHTLKVETVKL